MGFECGFDKVLKYKDTTLEEYRNITSYLYWKKHQFKDNDGNAIFPTYEDFWKSHRINESREYPGEPDPDKVEFYDTHRFEKEYDWQTEGYTSSSIQYWCSIGRYLDDNFIYDELRKKELYEHAEDYGPIDMDFVNKGLKWVDEELDKNKLIPVTIDRGFVYLDDGENIQTVNVDGIEIIDDSGNTRRIDSEYQYVYVSKNVYADPENLSVLESFKECLLKIKELLIEDKYMIYYYRSY